MKLPILITPIFLVMLFFLSLYFAVQSAYRWQNCQQKHQKIALALQKAMQAPEIFAQQKQQIDSLSLYLKDVNPSSTEASLLQQVEASCRSQTVSLISLPQERELTVGDTKLREIRFSLQGKLQDVLILSHRWEYHDPLGKLSYFKLAREQIRVGRRKQARLMAQLRFEKLM